MNITQIRNATVLIEWGDNRLLVDPMLASKGKIPSLKYATRKRQRNPVVELPVQSDELLASVTHCLITHCQKGHFDHLDRAAVKWLLKRNIPVYCMEDDATYLAQKGLNVHPLIPNSTQTFFNGLVTPVPCLHGKGIIGKWMAHGYGYVIDLPGEPSLYIAGDTILTETIKASVQRHKPDISIIPGGGARLDLGGEIIMGRGDVRAFVEHAEGRVLVNHLEALDHCPVTREQLRSDLADDIATGRVFIPEDGERIAFSASAARLTSPELVASEHH